MDSELEQLRAKVRALEDKLDMADEKYRMLIRIHGASDRERRIAREAAKVIGDLLSLLESEEEDGNG